MDIERHPASVCPAVYTRVGVVTGSEFTSRAWHAEMGTTSDFALP